MVRSRIMPKMPTTMGAISSAHQYPMPVRCRRKYAQNAPIM
jgi:hypothetical protein